MHRTSRAERLTTSCLRQHYHFTTTPQPFLYPERRLQPVAGRRHAPWAEIVKLPTRYMYFLFFCALLSLCSACLSNAIFFLGILFLRNGASFYDSPVCRKASSPGPEGLRRPRPRGPLSPTDGGQSMAALNLTLMYKNNAVVL